MNSFKILKLQSKQLVLNILNYFTREADNQGPIRPVTSIQERTADACNIHIRTLSRIISAHDANSLGGPKQRNKAKPKTSNLHEAIKMEVRNTVYDLCAKKVTVTLKILQKELKDREILHISLPSLSKLLKANGFKFKKECNRRFLCEQQNIVYKRVDFLKRYINHLDDGLRDTVFLDETWIFSRGTNRRAWQDGSIKSVRKIRGSGGKRFIILHAGSRNGFISGASLIFSSTCHSMDYHDSMNSETFEKWVENQLIPNLEQPSLIVMDNASYHSRLVEKNPTSSWKKSDITEWLLQYGIAFPPASLKVELLAIANANKIQKRYIVDEMLREHGHEVLRLPPYHCQFNAIELIWSNCKRYYDKHIDSCEGHNDEQVINMWHQALQQCTPTNWSDCIRHTEDLIKSWWERETVMDVNEIEPLIINNAGDSSSSDTEDSESSDTKNSDDF